MISIRKFIIAATIAALLVFGQGMSSDAQAQIPIDECSITYLVVEAGPGGTSTVYMTEQCTYSSTNCTTRFDAEGRPTYQQCVTSYRQRGY